jgi:predicted RNA-binding protein (TIGR00451 family)
MDLEFLLGFQKIKGISDYQFGPDITNIIFDNEDKIRIEKSRNTKKIRFIYYENQLILTLRPTNGFFTLSLFSAEKIIKNTKTPRMRVVILTEVSEFIKKKGNVFCKHVLDADNKLRPLDEVIVVNQNDELLGIGRLKVPVPYVRSFTSGIAVNVRKGVYKNSI